MGAALAAIMIAVSAAGLTAAGLANAQNGAEQRFLCRQPRTMCAWGLD
jgi:hypothetical protein